MRLTSLVIALALVPVGGQVHAAGAGAAAPEPLRPGGAVAVLPFESFAGAETPLAEIRETLLAKLEERSIPVLPEGDLDEIMRRHRMRYTGGLSAEMGRAFAGETAAGSVLVTSVDLYETSGVPKAALTSRLVSTGAEPRILWMDGAALAGDEEPGFLGLGMLSEISQVIDRIATRLADSLALTLSGEPGAAGSLEDAQRRFRPAKFYRSPEPGWGESSRPRVAVLPFSDGSVTRRAGDILTLQIVRYLAGASEVEILEPGVVRQTLLTSRIIQQEGPSIPQSDLLRSRLDVDVVIFGEVDEYQEAWAGGGDPVVGFTVRAMDTASRQVIWSSVSHGRGGEGVFFFGARRVATAQQLAAEMARSLVATILAAAGESS